MSKQFWIIVVVIILGVGGAIVFNNKNSNESAQAGQTSNNIRGGGSTGVTITEYADFQCSACEQYYPLVESVFNKYADQITFQFKHFPLTSLHPNAFAAARASEAAAKQGKFWEMYNMLYTSSNWNNWINSKNPQTYFDQYANNIGLNVEQFQTDFKSSAVNDIVRADLKEANDLKLSGTPTYFINGKQIENIPTDLDSWSQLIDEAIAAKQAEQSDTNNQ